MFRHERPQKGRQRQFHQFGLECFGMSGPDIDAELLVLTARFWRVLGVSGAVDLEINSIGSVECRARYKQALVEFLSARRDELDEDSRRRLETNPLRILDTKLESTQALLANAPDLADYISDEARSHFTALREYLDAADVSYRINSRLVRGLDYYNNTVFEWVTDRLGAQGTVCAGGRYDGLVEQLGGKPTPAVGFGMGVERLCLLLQEVVSIGDLIESAPDAYFVVVGDGLYSRALTASEHLRERLPGLKLQLHSGGGSFKSQMKKADRSGARWAIILGEDEAAASRFGLKALRDSEVGQQSLDLEGLVRVLEN